jgi:hypothetical protein
MGLYHKADNSVINHSLLRVGTFGCIIKHLVVKRQKDSRAKRCPFVGKMAFILRGSKLKTRNNLLPLDSLF